MNLKVTKVKINKRDLDRLIGNSKEFQKKAHAIVNQKLIKEKNLMMKEFNSHPVTQELLMGEEGKNVSGTLGGYGNLFSFMGFNSGSKPTEEVKRFLQTSIKLKPTSSKSKPLLKEYIINVPTMEDFKFAGMPWESGNSWIKSVERGMSSFSYFMHKAHQASRSGLGIQIDNNIHNKSSAPIKYMSQILNNFKKRLSK